MLNPDDRRAIEGLFDRLAEAERRSPQRDRDAEDLINRAIAQQPTAPYYLAQTVIVQQKALEMADRRITELEEQLAQRDRGGLFGGVFDDGRDRQNRAERQPARRGGPWDRQDNQPAYDQRADQRGNGFGGGGFLAGAAQTALGVAGGVMLGHAIGSMFGAGAAHAAQPADTNDGNDQQDNNQDNGQESGHESSHDGGGDSGGDWGGGGGGGFDTGGDF